MLCFPGLSWFQVRPTDHDVLRYSVHKHGAALSREFQEIIVPGDYGLYAIGVRHHFVYHDRLGTLTHMRWIRLETLLSLPSSSLISVIEKKIAPFLR
jgi:hypothetical protein